jgi:hypothetical protein
MSSDYIVYLDETGDHTLEVVDRDFPVFVGFYPVKTG